MKWGPGEPGNPGEVQTLLRAPGSGALANGKQMAPGEGGGALMSRVQTSGSYLL